MYLASLASFPLRHNKLSDMKTHTLNGRNMRK